MMGYLTERSNEALSMLIELSDDNIVEILFELLWSIDFEDAIREALFKRGYNVDVIDC